MDIKVHGKDVTLTAETINLTREYYINNALTCIKEAVSGEVRVNDLAGYIKWREASIEATKTGKTDHTLTFIQMAWYIQSGQCVPLL